MSRQRIVIYHTGYGCESGCCGHMFTLDDTTLGMFDFHHTLGHMSAEDLRKEFEPLVILHYGVEHAATLSWAEEDILRMDIEEDSCPLG